MKNIFTSSVLVLTSIAAFAQPQTNSVVSQSDYSAPAHSKGVTVGLAYSKFVEVNYKLKGTSTDNASGAKTDYTFDLNQKNNLPLVGLNVGYKNTYAFGRFGFDSSATLFKSTDTDQFRSDMSIIKVQGDVVYPINDTINLSIGPNISYLAGIDRNNDSDKATSVPGIGAQSGIQVEKFGVGIMIGYQTMGFYQTQTQTNTFSKDEGTADFRASGFISQIDYTF